MRFRVPLDGWDRTMSMGRYKYELGLKNNAFSYLELVLKNKAVLDVFRVVSSLSWAP